MYIIDFFKNLFRKKNTGLIIWLVLNTALIIAIFSNGFASWKGALVGLGIYLVSLVIALSPLGEWILRLQTGCKKMTNPDDIARLQPLFDEVYAKAKAKNPELPSDIKLFICEDDTPNAFATGRKTVCVNRGFFSYSDEHIKAVLGHEFGHLAHKDTDAILVVSVGNLIVTAIFVIIRILATIFLTIAQVVASSGRGITGVLGYIFTGMGKLAANVMLALLMRLWTQLGTWLCMSSSRGKEFEADQYSQECGYGDSLCEVLASFGSGGSSSKGLFASLSASHPDTDKRIANLKALPAPGTQAQLPN